MKQSIADLVNGAPTMTDDHYGELAVLFRRHEALATMFAYILDQATQDAVSLKDYDLGTEGGRAQALKLQGAIVGRQNIVNGIIMKMDEAQDTGDQETKPRKTRRTAAKKVAPKKSKR